MENSYSNISSEKAKKLMEQESVIILDVRTPMEYKQKHIPNSTLLPLDQIQKAVDIVKDTDIPILVYCRTGARSRIAAEQLIRLGYHQVYNMGGIINWKYEKVSGD